VFSGSSSLSSGLSSDYSPKSFDSSRSKFFDINGMSLSGFGNNFDNSFSLSGGSLGGGFSDSD
jgi:hypothetical protein